MVSKNFRVPAMLLGYALFLLVTEASAHGTAIERVANEHCVVAKIVRTIDGDTYKATIPVFPELLREVSIRPRGIDAPEPHSRCSDPLMKLAEQKFAKEVSAYADRILTGKVVLVCDLELDNFGRLLSDVYLFGEEKSLRQMLEDRSYVTPYKKGDDPWCNPELYKK